MPRGPQAKGILRENKMLHAAIELFLKNGYEKTTTASIARAAGMSPSSFFASFESKEALLLRLVQEMFRTQFSQTSALMPDKGDPVLLYSIETSLQIHITELSEPLRELYVAAYTLPSTAEYINVHTAKKLQQLFADYIPDATAKDFYELSWPLPGSPAALWRVLRPLLYDRSQTAPLFKLLPDAVPCPGRETAGSHHDDLKYEPSHHRRARDRKHHRPRRRRL